MRLLLIAIAALLLSAPAFAQSDDSLGTTADSLGLQVDSLTLPDTPAMEELVDSLMSADTADNISPMENAAQMLQLGKGDLSAGRIQEALDAFEKAVELAPNDPRAQNLKGKTLAMMGRNADALPSLDKAIELDPHFAEARFNRAGAYNLMDKPEAALSDLQAAIAEDTTLKALARNSSLFQSLQSDPRFVKMVK